MKQFYPTKMVTHFRDLDLDQLQAAGMTLILSDLDNTLVPNGVIECSNELHDWLHQLANRKMKLIIVSNNTENRVKKFAEPLGLEYYSEANKPDLEIYHRIFTKHNSDPAKAVMLGDRLFTDIYGGNKMGMYTVLVEPLDVSRGVSKRLRIKQLAEQAFLFVLHRCKL